MSFTPTPTPDGEKGQLADEESAPTVTITLKRQRELEEGFENYKRCKALIGSVAEEYICPITTELPVDPVTADDGRVYERWAIEKCIERQGDDLKSPVTNLPMGPRLLPALQVRNSIRKLIDSDTIESGLAKQWQQRIEKEIMVAETKKKAEQGDADAMCDLGLWYNDGLKGLSVDNEQSYQWYKKASDLHSVRGMAGEAFLLVSGLGTEKNEVYGTTLMGMAATSGSDLGAYYMGLGYLNGVKGMPKDKAKAKYWLRKVADGSCSVKSLWEGGCDAATETWRMLEEEEE